jgi:hypothetical protein
MIRLTRRISDLKAKAKVKCKAKRLGLTVDAKWIGRTASVHWTCACFMCTEKHKPLDADMKAVVLHNMAELYES